MISGSQKRGIQRSGEYNTIRSNTIHLRGCPSNIAETKTEEIRTRNMFARKMNASHENVPIEWEKMYLGGFHKCGAKVGRRSTLEKRMICVREKLTSMDL